MNGTFSFGYVPLMTKPSGEETVHCSVPSDATPVPTANPNSQPKTFAVISQDMVISHIPCL